MGDIALVWNDKEMGGDLSIVQNDIALDGGLDSAILLSLFCDRRALEVDVLPDRGTDRGGWWGDAFPPVADDRIGSRLWLLRREKQLPEALKRAAEYAREALQWLLEDKVAATLDVQADNPAPGIVRISVALTKPPGDRLKFAYDMIWRAQAAQG